MTQTATRNRDPRPHLTPHTAHLIREAVARGDKKSHIARAYGVSKSSVSRIARRLTDQVEADLRVLRELTDAEAELRAAAARGELDAQTAEDVIQLARAGHLLAHGFSFSQHDLASTPVVAISPATSTQAGVPTLDIASTTSDPQSTATRTRRGSGSAR